MTAKTALLPEGNSSIAMLFPKETIQIAGAGPAGLAAAITLARAGRAVIVHEARAYVGYRFQGDLQGLENWSTKQDVLTSMHELGLSTSFDKVPGLNGIAYDAWRDEYAIQSPEPLFYVVERGPGPNSLDSALLNQALELGVEVRFNSRLRQLEGPGILATGPQAADAIAVGYHFETDMENGFWVICDNNLAPQGYAYLLTMNGIGTVKSCMFADFKKQNVYVQRTVKAFEKLVGLHMHAPRSHGGIGNFKIPMSAMHGQHPMVGEQAGFQDTLWGFGMRHAMTSGVLAAQCLLNNGDYNQVWRQALGRNLLASVVNRVFYGYIRNIGYRSFLRYATKQDDVRGFLRRFYQLTSLKRLTFPWVRRHYRSRYKDRSCDDSGCLCVQCHCGTTSAELGLSNSIVKGG